MFAVCQTMPNMCKLIRSLTTLCVQNCSLCTIHCPRNVDGETVKPRIDRTNLKNITIKAGKSMIWSVDVKGEPEPEIIWSWRDDIPLTETQNIKIENGNYHTNFSIKEAKRVDTGKYKIVAQNVNGKDEETVELVVLGAPGRPQGKLEVSNVTKKGLKLKWKKPADDGGSPILEYKIEKLKNRNAYHTCLLITQFKCFLQPFVAAQSV